MKKKMQQKLDMHSVEAIEKKLRQVSDFPKPGIQFLDMTPVLAEKGVYTSLIHHMCKPYFNQKIDKIVAIEARGFVLGAAMAQLLDCGLVLVRKKGKLPGPTISVSYALEYGNDQLETLPQSISAGENVIIVDDVLATGGTAAATFQLCEKMRANVLNFSFFIEIGFLQGRKKLSVPVNSLLMK
jgi:adenine phosphoribosyltransferase